MSKKAKSPPSKTQGMEGEDFGYSGAGPASDAKKPAVVSGEVKKTEVKRTSAKTPAKGVAEEAKWGNRNQGQQMPGGMPEAEDTGEEANGSS
jgi:hypothetical protein